MGIEARLSKGLRIARSSRENPAYQAIARAFENGQTLTPMDVRHMYQQHGFSTKTADGGFPAFIRSGRFKGATVVTAVHETYRSHTLYYDPTVPEEQSDRAEVKRRIDMAAQEKEKRRVAAISKRRTPQSSNNKNL